MNAHTKTPADPRILRYVDLEGPVCELARLALAVSIIAEDLRKGLKSSARVYKNSDDLLDAHKAELELLFAYVDDAKDNAQALRNGYYGRTSS